MNPTRRHLLLALATLPLGLAAPADAGLLGGDEHLLDAVPFDYEAAASNPGSLAPDYFGTHSTKGLANLRRVIIPSFQVRFRMQDDVERTSKTGSSTISFSTSRSAGVDVELPEALRQQLTDDLYERVVARLKDLGIEVLPIPADLDLPELREGIKAMPPRGTIEDLTVYSQRVSKRARSDRSKWFYPWAVHYPTQVTAVAYSGVMEGLPPLVSWIREAEMPQMPISTMKIGKAMGAGILTLGFEVTLEKMSFKSGGFLSKGPTIEAKPVLATRLLSVKLVPEDGGRRVAAIGMSGGIMFPGMNYDGFGIQPLQTVFGSASKDFPWVELNGSYGDVTGTGVDGRWQLKPEPEALAADFRKNTEAQLAMIFQLIGEARK